jgi:catechol 2,3-dioxygenase-like lactoylglutathione lyase family enzyme
MSTGPAPPSVHVSHVGLCVSDLERSLRFYCDGLGFDAGARFDVGSDFGPTLEVDGDVRVTSQFVTRDGLSIELLHYHTPGVHGVPSSTRNQLGFTHLCIRVDDIDAIATRLVAAGGSIVAATRYELELGAAGTSAYVFVADPDGVRVELMQLPR